MSDYSREIPSDMEFKSFAKVNIGLEIIGKRDDGFHKLKTIFQTISLYDTIEITENSDGLIHLSGDDKSIFWDKSNTISKAFSLMYDLFNLDQGFNVNVKKSIPPGSGLGGGSSNAAVIMMFITDYFKLKISKRRLERLGSTIGADIPFFFTGGTVLGEGIGEKITPLEDLGEIPVGLVIPNINISTKEIFSRFNLTKTTLKSKINSFLSSGDISALENELEFTTFKVLPELKKMKMKMESIGLDYISMSGTGSSLFCFHSKEQKVTLKSIFPKMFFEELLSRKRYQNSIGAWPSGKASVFGADTRRFESSRPRIKK